MTKILMEIHDDRKPDPGPQWRRLAVMTSAEQAEHAIVAGYELIAFVLGDDKINGWQRQIAWELYNGPQRIDLVATGPAESLADAKAQAEAAWHIARAKVPVDPSRAIELAYGLLWDTWLADTSRAGLAIKLARQALLEHLDKAGQARGISLAKAAMTALHNPAAPMRSQATVSEQPGPRTLGEFFALPEGPAFGMRIEGRIQTPVAPHVVAFFADPDMIISNVDGDGERWTLGRYNDGRWFRRRGL